jgi:hypothetical protein
MKYIHCRRKERAEWPEEEDAWERRGEGGRASVGFSLGSFWETPPPPPGRLRIKEIEKTEIEDMEKELAETECALDSTPVTTGTAYWDRGDIQRRVESQVDWPDKTRGHG